MQKEKYLSQTHEIRPSAKGREGFRTEMKRFMRTVLVAILALSMMMLGGCGSGDENAGNSGSSGSGSTGTPTGVTSQAIHVVSREDGSGTRSAFVELFDVRVADANGKPVDATTNDAIITNSTSVTLTTVANDPAAIGYISLGSMNDSVRALDINGVAATTANVKTGVYVIQRDFNIATLGEVSAAAQDFINFIMSAEGQKVIEDNHYIAVNENAKPFVSNNASGKVVVGGSSSVSPVMEKLVEAYATANPKVAIEIQTSDSSVGMSSTIEGILEIGMASRELKDSELASGLVPTTIAIDGLAVIVNNDNAITGLSVEQVRSIFLGETTNWADLS